MRLMGSVFSRANRTAGGPVDRRALLDAICADGGVSRAQLAKLFGISKPAAASNVERLLATGLIEERGAGESGKNGGRKPILLRLNAGHRFIGAVDLSLSTPVCAVSDLLYNVRGIRRVSVADNAPPVVRRAAIGDAFESIFREQGLSFGEIGRLVVSLPGVIEGEGTAHFSQRQHHHWTEIDLHEYLGARFDVGVSVLNDVNAAALGELHFGGSERLENLIYVSCGAGLGAGVIIRRQLYEGARKAAGEIGAFLSSDGTSVESRVATDGLLERARGLLMQQGYEAQAQGLEFGGLVQLVGAGNKAAEQAVYETGRELGAALHNAGILLDIETIILGGDYIQLGDRLFEGIEDSMKGGSIFRPEVLPSSLCGMAGVYGAFVAGREKIIDYFASL